MAYTTHYNLLQLPTGAVDWVSGYNDAIGKIEQGRTLKLTASESLDKGDPFFINSSGEAAKVNATSQQVGLWQTSSNSSATDGYGQVEGVMSSTGWNWTPGDKIYASTAGALTTVAPISANAPIALAFSSQEVLINPMHRDGPQRVYGILQTVDTASTVLITRTLTSGSAYLCIANVVGKASSAARGAYVRSACVYRGAATTAILEGSVDATLTIESNSSWDCTIATSSNTVQVTVQGKTTVDWHGELTLLEV